MGGWNTNEIKVRVIDCTEQVITIICDDPSRGYCWCSFVYGLHTIGDRQSLWLELDRIGVIVPCKWMVVGDFNYAFESDQRIGEAVVTELETQDGVTWL